MKNKSRFTGSVLAAFVAVMMLAVPVAGNTQETSSAVRGVVTSDSGTPLANSTVTVLSDNSGFSRTATTGSSGEFTIRGLPIDSYTISVASSGYASQESPGLRVNLGQTANVNFVLTTGDIEEIIVTGSEDRPYRLRSVLLRRLIWTRCRMHLRSTVTSRMCFAAIQESTLTKQVATPTACSVEARIHDTTARP